MQTSRFQLGLIATLAMGLGLALSSSQAVGYPAGAAVSLGANPVWSFGGTNYVSGEVIFTAPPERDMVLTDLSLSTTYQYQVKAGLSVGAEVVGEWIISGKASNAYTGSPLNLTMTSGIRVPAGYSLTLATGDQYISYAMSGYYAQP